MQFARIGLANPAAAEREAADAGDGAGGGKLRRRRDAVADKHGLEPSFIAPRGALDAVAADESQSTALLVPWQRSLLEL